MKTVKRTPTKTKPAKPTDESVLVLRLCKKDMTSKNGFVWPSAGHVEAPDWAPIPKCGAGLHGWLWGQGDHSSCEYFDAEARWLVVLVKRSDLVDLKGKVKFRCGKVVHCGDRATATRYLQDHGASGSIIGATLSAGDLGTASAGDRGTASAGKDGLFSIRWWDSKADRWRIAVGYAGEDGIEIGKPYHVVDGKLTQGELPEAIEARARAAAISAKKPVDR